jgi:hypothetical protein
MNLRQEVQAYQIFKQLNDYNHLSGKFWFGLCTLRGVGSIPNKEEGVRLLRQVGENGDSFWTKTIAQYHKFGYKGFQANILEYKKLNQSASEREVLECSLFGPNVS